MIIKYLKYGLIIIMIILGISTYILYKKNKDLVPISPLTLYEEQRLRKNLMNYYLILFNK